ncbi:MAG TPA: alpha/beta fold hydrolase [Jatrophihabitantaceae bacterium]|nr:alpha/beta fold hydrolase [Jatrophihabitantaceae bacterium]
MRLRAPIAFVGTALAAATLLGAPSPAAATQYRVPYTFTVSAVTAGINPDADPPGANDWSCRPSAAHPNPVVLVHGTGGNKNTNWQTYAPLLANNGYCVFALTYGVIPGAQLPLNQVGGLDRIENSAAQLGTFVDKVLAATGAAKVDIVGHSQGTLMPNYYAKFLGGASKIDKYIGLASLWHGSNVGGSATLLELGRAYGFTVPDGDWGASAQMATGSDFINAMRAGGVPQPGITYTNIVTKYDELVVPYTSGIEAGMHNIVVQDQCRLDFSDHLEIVADPIASVDVLNALDPAHPRAVPCQLVLPFL